MVFNTYSVQSLTDSSATTLQRLADLARDAFDQQQSILITSDVYCHFCATQDCECLFIDLNDDSFNSTNSSESSFPTPWRLHSEFIRQLKKHGDETPTTTTFCHPLCDKSNYFCSDMSYTDWEEDLKRASTPHQKMWSQTLEKDKVALMMLMGHRVTEFVNCF